MEYVILGVVVTVMGFVIYKTVKLTNTKKSKGSGNGSSNTGVEESENNTREQGEETHNSGPIKLTRKEDI